MPGVFETQLDSESPLRVVITPSQSSFFAGEQFSVTITFTNVRSPEAGTSKSHSERANTQTRTHKRGAHSISSAPLAQPPTSPGTPRTLASFSSQKLNGYNGGELPRRRGLIGTTKVGCQDAHRPQLIEQRGKKIQAKSLSISISPQESEEQAGERARAVVPISAPSYQQSYFDARQCEFIILVPKQFHRGLSSACLVTCTFASLTYRRTCSFFSSSTRSKSINFGRSIIIGRTLPDYITSTSVNYSYRSLTFVDNHL